MQRFGKEKPELLRIKKVIGKCSIRCDFTTNNTSWLVPTLIKIHTKRKESKGFDILIEGTNAQGELQKNLLSYCTTQEFTKFMDVRPLYGLIGKKYYFHFSNIFKLWWYINYTVYILSYTQLHLNLNNQFYDHREW